MHLFSGVTTTQLNNPVVNFFTSASFMIFLLALVLRLAVAAWLPDRTVWPDGKRYESVAMNLLEEKSFGSIEKNRRSVPTQPILIALVYGVFGKSYFALRSFFAVLGAATCVMGYALTKRLFGTTSAVITGVLLAIYPYYIYLSALFEYPQTFYIFIMSFFFLLFYKYLELHNSSVLFLSGVFLGVAVLSVPTALLYLPFVFLHVFSGSFAVSTRRLVTIVIAVAIPVGTWSVHNYIAYGQFILVNAAGGTNFWAANNETYYQYGKEAVIPACANGYEDTEYCKEKKALRQTQLEQNLQGVQRVLQDEAASWKNGLHFITNFPAESVVLVVRKFFELWSPIPNAVHRKAAHGGATRDIISIISYTPILILGVFGIILSIRKWRRFTLIYTYFLAGTVPYCIFLPTTRYRLPLDFFLLMFAAVALTHWWERKGRALVDRVENYSLNTNAFESVKLKASPATEPSATARTGVVEKSIHLETRTEYTP